MFFYYFEEKDKADVSTAKGEKNDPENNADASSDTSHHGNLLFGPEAGWKTVGKRHKVTKDRKYGKNVDLAGFR